MDTFNRTLIQALFSLERYCEKVLWKGYDPYDGLNSLLFKITPFYKKPAFRLAWSFLVRNLPFNARPFLLISKGYNPKALALFISSYSRLYSTFKEPVYLSKARFLAKILQSKQIKDFTAPSWGYNFPWQSKVLFAPEGVPNAICTTFAGQALLDLWEITKQNEFANIARAICDFLLNDLNKLETQKGICFSYTPLDNVWVHNVNLWIAAFLSRVWSLTGEDFLLEIAKKAVNFTLSYQNSDGSWFYGTGNKNLLYIDNYHTGFNIVALREFINYTGESSPYESHLRRGYDYYKRTFFLPSGAPRYYHNKLFPMDIHCSAQGIITHTLMGDIERAKKIAEWTIENMFNPQKGFFYYRKLPAYTIKIPFIRWGEGWMFYALTYLITTQNTLSAVSLANKEKR
ncbi:delta-aminolevulinic acid dehydratase [bacterium]|nr:delta-aminolevulinic acid dehydratase [bacterium]